MYEGDNWVVECDDSPTPGGLWTAGQTVFLHHAQTGQYLTTGKSAGFNQRNCRGCPIIGQQEVSCTRNRGADARWKVFNGVFMPKPEDETVVDKEL